MKPAVKFLHPPQYVPTPVYWGHLPAPQQNPAVFLWVSFVIVLDELIEVSQERPVARGVITSVVSRIQMFDPRNLCRLHLLLRQHLGKRSKQYKLDCFPDNILIPQRY
ncbi:hypothetical protein P879_12069 [Paragonimus westermani]|uniref:Uncharacterized protein n=1 Tax=Paragonimus westermani TaxID=34504 RepID=A0A8T0D5X7_9TREM|nr:hypothetical protein P879_12069 [Paragonimus westermani]